MKRHLSQLSLCHDWLTVVMWDTTYLVLHLVGMMHIRFDQLWEDTGAVIVHIAVSLLNLHSLTRHHPKIFVEFSFIELLLLHSVILSGMHERGVLHERLPVLLLEQRT